MFLQNNTNQDEVPPIVREETLKLFSGKTMIFGIVIFLGVVLSDTYSQKLDSIIPYGRYLWILFIFFFLIYVINLSNKINKGLKQKGTDIGREYNKHGDAQLFQSAIKTGRLKIFDFKYTVILLLVNSFCLLFFIFGLLALHLVFFKNIKVFLPLGLIGILVGLGVSFLFVFGDKRILNEARRRNQFVDIAEQRWKITKIIYIIMILISVMITLILIKNNINFLEKGTITSNGQVIYNGAQQ
jgi:hypothetical protein